MYTCKCSVRSAYSHWLAVSVHEWEAFSAFTNISSAHQHASRLHTRSATLVRLAELQHRVTPLHQQVTHHKPSCISQSVLPGMSGA